MENLIIIGILILMAAGGCFIKAIMDDDVIMKDLNKKEEFEEC